jgi:hypothetical protein
MLVYMFSISNEHILIISLISIVCNFATSSNVQQVAEIRRKFAVRWTQVV